MADLFMSLDPFGEESIYALFCFYCAASLADIMKFDNIFCAGLLITSTFFFVVTVSAGHTNSVSSKGGNSNFKTQNQYSQP